jgi:pimeloyl-ACP methyl ester carboxylesterase
MRRHTYKHDGLTLSFLDDGGEGQPLIALHAHWMEGLTYAPLAKTLAPEWRVIAPDQRGHGHSDHTKTYTRDDYLGDLEALLAHLDLRQTVMLGNSLGGVNAYQFAARHPDRIKALIIEDIGAEIDDDADFVLKWTGTFKTREELQARVGPRMAPYLEESFRQTPKGWTLAFDPNNIVSSQRLVNGNHWQDWLATTCPALLIHGRQSPITTKDQIEAMAARRPHTQLQVIDSGHVVHVDNPQAFAAAVKGFLQQI